MADHPADRVLEAVGLAVTGAHSPMLRPTTVSVGTGVVHGVVGDPGHGHTALALALGGRLVPTDGTVTLDDDPDLDRLARAVALVDVPGVSEPDGVLPLGTVIGEELAMARRPADRASVGAWASPPLLRTRIEDVPAAERVALLLRLTAQRPGTRFLVLTMPERYGALPADWEPVATELAAQGFGVLVTMGLAAATHARVALSAIGGADGPPETGGHAAEEA